MDNTRDLPGYKYYVDPVTGERPEVFVAFLDLEAARARLRGIIFAVDSAMLRTLDARERNYRRTDVTIAVEPPAPGQVWAYFGNEDARARFARGRASGTVVVAEAYYERVRSDLARLGETLERPRLPIRPLSRVDLEG